MAKGSHATFRLSPEDRAIFQRLQQLTGLPASGVLRLVIREALTAREALRSGRSAKTK